MLRDATVELPRLLLLGEDVGDLDSQGAKAQGLLALVAALDARILGACHAIFVEQ